MEQLKKRRTNLRTAFTKALNLLNALLEDVTSGTAETNVVYVLVVDKHKELEDNATSILDALYSGEAADDEVQKEIDEHDAYKSRFLLAKYKFDVKMTARSARASSASPVNTTNNSANQAEARKTYNLPKIELVKFNGNVREWLQFWSLFKKIHEDVNMDNEDKFQYLIQAMVPGSRASDLVKSYPPTNDNYEKAIDSLKKRFGRDDLQIEVYVRELLQLVLQNALSSKEVQLASLYDKIESYLRALDTLGVTTDKCAAMLFPLVESSLPEELLRVWQRSNSASETNTAGSSSDVSKTRLNKLISFLESEVQNELRISMAVQGFSFKEETESERTKKSKNQTSGKDVPSARNLMATKGKENSCIFCEKSDHDSAKCFKAKNMSSSERQDAVKKNRACFSCLKIGHNSRFCRVNVKYSKCARRHVDIMCSNDENRANSHNGKPTNSVSAVNIQEECNLALSTEVPMTFMQTLKVRVRSDSTELIVRAVINTGCQNSYILREVADKLDYQPLAEQDMVHLLFGGEKSSITTHKKYRIRVGNLDGSYWCNFQAMDESVICADVPLVTKGSWLRELERMNVILTDVCSKEKTVDILIGADVAGKLLTGRLQRLESGLTAVETYLGWTLMGKVPPEASAINQRENLAVSAISMFARNADIEDLWSLDILGIRDPIDTKTQEQHDIEVEEAFRESVIKNEEGRYEVTLPWRESHPELRDNKAMALQRLVPMVKKLQVAGKYDEYEGIFQEWLKEGIIERVPPEEEEHWGNYLPHRPIFKEHSTTSTRPIYDASSGSPPLNRCLEKGPNLIEQVCDILMRFREGDIGVIADIKKAFLQISVSPAERDFLRFLWYDAEGKLIIYRHCRVVFGVCSSPFILGATINLHLDNYLKSIEFDDSAENSMCMNVLKLKHSFYVDNCVTSVNNLNDLCSFIHDAKTVMESGLFGLRGWEHTSDDNYQNLSGVLGLLWDKQQDCLSLNVSGLEKLESEKVTKRNILSVAHRIFDPLGFVCPVSLSPKILLQEAWAAKFSWDEEVSEDIKKRFAKWIEELENLDQVKVSRCMIGVINTDTDVSMHTFVDASKLAYAAVIFMRVQRGLDVQVYFVQAKTRVAPSIKSNANKSASIPRLELLAATIGTRLSSQALKALDFKGAKTYYWTDSSTVVAWINRDDNWSIFVANRVKEIRDISESKQWRHIPGHLNPADLPSRGCTVNQLLASRWWEGPEWLRESENKWPTVNQGSVDEAEVNSELKKSARFQSAALFNIEKKEIIQNDHLLYSLSSYSKVVRVIGWIKRFIHNCKKKVEARKENSLPAASNLIKINYLTPEEYGEAEIGLIRIIQNRHFDSLEDERIRDFLPFLDSKGLIRTKSRLLYREDSFNLRCPIILPSKEYFVELLIREKHIELKHAGVTITLNVLREKFWIIKGRKTVREVIKICVDCRRHDSKQVNTHTAPLPLDRVRDAAIFEVIGVDFAGPIYLKGGQKAWICIFTCAVYRAVHLELVNSLNVASFLMALRRHIARRGRPKEVTGIGVIDLDKLEEVKMNKRFTYRQKIKQDLRQRFRNEYLGALTHRKRKGHVCRELKIGDVVLVGNDNAKRIDWPLAKVKEFYFGKDGHIRVVRLITATGEMTRPIQRLYPLELSADCKSENEVQIVIKKLRVAKTLKGNDKLLDGPKDNDIVRQAKEVQTKSGRKSILPNRLTYN